MCGCALKEQVGRGDYNWKLFWYSWEKKFPQPSCFSVNVYPFINIRAMAYEYTNGYSNHSLWKDIGGCSDQLNVILLWRSLKLKIIFVLNIELFRLGNVYFERINVYFDFFATASMPKSLVCIHQRASICVLNDNICRWEIWNALTLSWSLNEMNLL
jgi:hypothetical protein